MRRFIFIGLLFVFVSCDPVYDIYLSNKSKDTLYVRVNKYTDPRKEIKFFEYYPDSSTSYPQRQHIYIVPPEQKLEIGSRIGFGGPSEKDISCDSMIIESKDLTIIARNKAMILKLISEYDQEGEYEFIIR